MTDLEYVEAADLKPPGGHYSYAVRAGEFIFISGLLPADLDTESSIPRPFVQQVAGVLARLDAILLAGGSSREHLVQVRAYLTQMSDWSDFNRIYAGWIGAGRPARCVVPVSGLRNAAAIEVEAVACEGRRTE
jgi:2-iminobutanoate/2-iminopropanoate deaminase